MNDENKKLNIETEIERGNESLKAAEILHEKKLYADSISRAYYAAFHYAQAILLTIGIEAKSHPGVLNRFSLHFVKSGRIDPKYARILSKAHKFREESDYSSMFVFTKEDAEQNLKEVKEFIQAVQKQL